MSGDGMHLLKKLGSIGTTAMKGPTGRWFLTGRVPVRAGYERKDGQPLTARDEQGICQMGSLPWCRTKTYATQEEALAAAATEGE